MATTTDQTQSNGLYQTSDYVLNVSIATGSGALQDLTPLILHFNLYENLFSPSMTGDMVFSDGLDVITKYSLNGNEWIYVTLDKPGLNKPIKKAFRIYKISNRQTMTQALQNYVIYFCSEELILSSQLYVRKAYNGTIDRMITNILADYMGADTKINKNIFYKPSGNYNFTISRMRPFEAISWLASRAYDANKNLYFFYETPDGYNFASYEDLLKIEPYGNYAYEVNVVADPSKNYKTVQYLKVDHDFDVLLGNKFGQFSSSLYALDIVKRTYELKTLKGDSFNSGRLLNSNLSTDSTKNRLNKSIFDMSDAYVKFHVLSDADSTVNPIKPQNWLLQDAMKGAQLRGLKLTINIPSDFEIRSGRTINLLLPLGNPQDSEAAKNDSYRSARYLITAIRHGISGQLSSTTLELMSDSFNKALPNPVNNSAPLQQLKGL